MIVVSYLLEKKKIQEGEGEWEEGGRKEKDKRKYQKEEGGNVRVHDGYIGISIAVISYAASCAYPLARNSRCLGVDLDV